MEHDNNLLVASITAIILGVALKLFVGRRKFYRRNQAGLETFKKYRDAITISFFERIISIVGGILIVSGVLFLGLAILVGK